MQLGVTSRAKYKEKFYPTKYIKLQVLELNGPKQLTSVTSN